MWWIYFHFHVADEVLKANNLLNTEVLESEGAGI
jgi:hypothetical protein